MKLNLTYVNRTERTSKAGKPFTSISIKATQYGDRYISGFGSKDNANWKSGDEVEVEKVEEKGKYLNFEMPKFQKTNPNVEIMALSHKVDLVSQQLRSVIDHLSGKSRLDQTSVGTPIPFQEEYPKNDGHEDAGLDEINPEDIPF